VNREALLRWAGERYGSEPEYPWEGDPDSAVLRRADSGKWYALFMKVSGSRLHLSEEGPFDIMNVKTGPMLAGSLLREEGILPAYHMNKEHWVTVLLERARPELARELMEMSYDSVGGKRKARPGR